MFAEVSQWPNPNAVFEQARPPIEEMYAKMTEPYMLEEIATLGRRIQERDSLLNGISLNKTTSINGGL